MVANTKQEEWWTSTQVLEYLKISPRKLQTLRDNGTLPYSRPFGGSKILYKRSDIEKLLEDGYTG